MKKMYSVKLSNKNGITVESFETIEQVEEFIKAIKRQNAILELKGKKDMKTKFEILF